MRRASRFILSALLAVLLATVLAPSFGWEAAAGQTGQDHDVTALSQDDLASGDIFGRGGEDSHHGHGCAGHMFGHLSALLDEAASLALPDADGATFFRRMHGVITSFLKRLDRPPHAPDLA